MIRCDPAGTEQVFRSMTRRSIRDMQEATLWAVHAGMANMQDALILECLSAERRRREWNAKHNRGFRHLKRGR
jgi:hypothetical protein